VIEPDVLLGGLPVARPVDVLLFIAPDEYHFGKLKETVDRLFSPFSRNSPGSGGADGLSGRQQPHTDDACPEARISPPIPATRMFSSI
jgi:hypothetical protein